VFPRDITGYGRYLPIRVSNINVTALKRNRRLRRRCQLLVSYSTERSSVLAFCS